MEQKKHSAKFLKQRKFLMVLPLLILPFIIIIFVALGGGKGNGAQANTSHTSIGINMKLPDAHFKKGKEKDKLGLYEEAGKDSAKLNELIKNDPYYKPEFHAEEEETGNKPTDLQTILQHAASKYNQTSLSNLKTSVGTEKKDSNEEKVMAKLATLKLEINKKTTNSSSPLNYYPQKDFSHLNPEVEKLENMIKAINTKNETDPELKQLSTMLDKIMLVQHPEKLQDSLAKIAARNKADSFSVTMKTEDEKVSCLNTADSIQGEMQNRFYDLSDQVNRPPVQTNSIEAVINETQTLVSGDPITIRLLSDVFINGVKIPKNDLVAGTTSLSNERLKVSVNSITYQDHIFHVAMEAYDMKGMPGLYIQGSMSSDVGKESVNQAISSISLASLDPSIGAQAASAGIQAAKTLAGKKIKLVRVTVKSGYHLLLMENNKQ